MKILIPSRSRPHRLVTPYQIPKELRDNTYVCVPEEQIERYARCNPKLNILAVGDLNDHLGRKLELMAMTANEEHVMLCDDDFSFFRRKEPDGPGLRKMESEDWSDMFNQIHEAFEENVYGVGISMRQGNNRIPPEGRRNTRINGCIVYKRKLFLDPRIIHDRVNPMNDFDVNLQLLRLGYENRVISQFCYNQPGTNSPGGSSDYRTLETQDAAARKLAEMHPGLVRLRQKNNKTGDPSLRERTEVTIYWKKSCATSK